MCFASIFFPSAVVLGLVKLAIRSLCLNLRWKNMNRVCHGKSFSGGAVFSRCEFECWAPQPYLVFPSTVVLGLVKVAIQSIWLNQRWKNRVCHGNLFQGAPCLADAGLNAGRHSHILSFLRQLCWVWSSWPSSQSG